MSDNPFDNTTPSYVSQTSTHPELIRMGCDNLARALRVCMPAAIVRVRGNQLVDVEPSFKATYVAAAKAQKLPVVPLVPVCMPMGATWGLRMPLAVGDLGMLVFADRAMDTWMAGTGDPVDPVDPRTHDLTDAIFVPGLYPTGKQTTDQTTDLVLTNGASEVRLLASGKVHIGNATLELVDLAKQLADVAGSIAKALQTAVMLTPMGPANFIASDIAKFVTATTQLQALSTSLATLKG